MEIKELIKSRDLEKLTAQVFEAKLSADSLNTYTMVLLPEDELAIAKILVIELEKEKWLQFMLRYISKYPLANKVVEYLIAHSGIKEVTFLLVSLFSHYGYTIEQGIQICKISKDHDNDQVKELLQMVCSKDRFYNEEIHKLLENLDLYSNKKTAYADTYNRNTKKYRIKETPDII